MLSPYRVIELSNGRTGFCGQILADLGADVIAVEPPGGSEVRRQGPFRGDVPHPDRSLAWWAYNTNKRSVTIDIATDDGKALLKRLVPRADFLVEGFDVGYLDSLGIGYEGLSAINPRVIVVSITAFGQAGPKAARPATDLTIYAASSTLSTWGYPEAAPVRITEPQAYLHAGAEGAVGALLAHFARLQTGEGQHVDVSAQAAVTISTQSWTLAGAWRDVGSRRGGAGVQLGILPIQVIFPCKDGHVTAALYFGGAIGPVSQRLMVMAHREGFADESLVARDWVGYGARLLSGAEPISEYERAVEALRQLFAGKTKDEIFRLGLLDDVFIPAVATTADIAASRQLDARGFWDEVEHEELSASFTYPGCFATFGERPAGVRRRPPLLGEHNADILGGELGLSVADLALLRAVDVV